MDIKKEHFTNLIAALIEFKQKGYDENQLLKAIADHLLKELTVAEWAKYAPLTVDPNVGYVSYLIHEEPQHALAIELQSWLPGNKTEVHDHGTWGVVVVLSGLTNNEMWARLDDGKKPNYSQIERTHNVLCAPGTILCMTRKALHALSNAGNEPTLELHIYGTNPNFTERLAFDPKQNRAKPYKIAQSFLLHDHKEM